MRPEPGAQAASASLRASRADRERVIDLLKAAFVAGRLARDEFDARIGQVRASRTYAELAAATADIPADIPAALLEAPPPRPPARTRGRVSMNTAVTAGAGVILAANVAMLAALFIGSPVAVVLVAALTVIGVSVTIAAMIVSP